MVSTDCVKGGGGRGAVVKKSPIYLSLPQQLDLLMNHLRFFVDFRFDHLNSRPLPLYHINQLRHFSCTLHLVTKNHPHTPQLNIFLGLQIQPPQIAPTPNLRHFSWTSNLVTPNHTLPLPHPQNWNFNTVVTSL